MSSRDRVSDLVAYLEGRILSGDLAPGDLLPSERTISIERGVSRSVVREAINRLASLGLVRSWQGSGTRVEAPSPGLVTRGYKRLLHHGEVDLGQLAEVRLPLETTIAGLAARYRKEEHLSRLEGTQQILGQAEGTLEEQVQADLEFHAVLAEASGNPLFGMVLAPMQELLIESRRRTLGRHGARLAYGHHGAILEAVRGGDEEQAREAMRRHLETNVRHLSGERAPTQEMPSRGD